MKTMSFQETDTNKIFAKTESNLFVPYFQGHGGGFLYNLVEHSPWFLGHFHCVPCDKMVDLDERRHLFFANNPNEAGGGVIPPGLQMRNRRQKEVVPLADILAV